MLKAPSPSAQGGEALALAISRSGLDPQPPNVSIVTQNISILTKSRREHLADAHAHKTERLQHYIHPYKHDKMFLPP